jgi:hypothetical protein
MIMIMGLTSKPEILGHDSCLASHLVSRCDEGLLRPDHTVSIPTSYQALLGLVVESAPKSCVESLRISCLADVTVHLSEYVILMASCCAERDLLAVVEGASSRAKASNRSAFVSQILKDR